MHDLIGLVLAHATDPASGPHLSEQIAAHIIAVRASAGGGERSLVFDAEEEVRVDPAAAFAFDASGSAILTATGRNWSAGRFETVSIGELRDGARRRATGGTGRVRLWVFDGASPATDIGTLQATAGSGVLFQVASQFNCLESPGQYVTCVADYFKDSTQGPRASISAFPATLLRHYAAPGPNGERFVQETDLRQIDLLVDACGPGFVGNGYLTGKGLANPAAVLRALEDRFDAIRVGVHDEVQVVFGYDWDGAVEGSQPRRIAQVFTSTVAGGIYGGEEAFGRTFNAVCRQLLRAAYLGTLLAAVTLGRARVVLTLIGGGVFRNPVALIWEAIQWAIDEVEPLLSHDLDVIVNGRSLSSLIDLKAAILPAVRSRGAVIAFDALGRVTIF